MSACKLAGAGKRRCFVASCYCDSCKDCTAGVCPLEEPRVRRRPDLYVYDPIINEKQSTYQGSYDAKPLHEQGSENYRKVYLFSKYTLKPLYDEYRSNPVRALKPNVTISGSDYVDPMDTVESKLLQNFYTKTSSNKINSSFNDKRIGGHLLFPDESASRSAHRDFGNGHYKPNPRHRRQAADSTAPANNASALPSRRPFYPVRPRVYFKVPFNGDTSTYAYDFKDPAAEPPYLKTVFRCFETEEPSPAP